MEMGTLSEEAGIFEQKRAEWSQAHLNEWVWILGEKVSFFPSLEKAIEAAYAAGFDKQPIFVKQVLQEDIPLYIAGLSHRFQWAG